MTAQIAAAQNVRLWHKVDIERSGLLPCKLTVTPISSVANPSAGIARIFQSPGAPMRRRDFTSPMNKQQI
jgi:hypothetical protein